MPFCIWRGERYASEMKVWVRRRLWSFKMILPPLTVTPVEIKRVFRKTVWADGKETQGKALWIYNHTSDFSKYLPQAFTQNWRTWKLHCIKSCKKKKKKEKSWWLSLGRNKHIFPIFIFTLIQNNFSSITIARAHGS